MDQIRRMIGAGPQSLQEAYGASGVLGRPGDDLLEEILINVVGAGESRQKSAGAEPLHGLQANVLVSARSRPDIALRLGKRGRIEDDQVEEVFRFPQILEDVGPDYGMVLRR